VAVESLMVKLRSQHAIQSVPLLVTVQKQPERAVRGRGGTAALVPPYLYRLFLHRDLASAALYAILVTGLLGDCRKILYQATPD